MMMRERKLKKFWDQLGFEPKTFWILVRCSGPTAEEQNTNCIYTWQHCVETSVQFQLTERERERESVVMLSWNSYNY